MAAPALALIRAPFLPRLALEGYPGQTWPAAGTFARVDGGTRPLPVLAPSMPGAAFDPVGKRLFEDKDGTALLIWQGGQLRFEHYADGFGPTSRFNSYSMVKSLIGALVLRAHAEGRIASLQDPIGRYLDAAGDAAFRAVPIIEFLRMRSGVVFEPAGKKAALGGGAKDIEATRLNPFGPMARLHMLGPDAVLGELRIRPEARGRYAYQNVNTAVLGRLLATVYGRPLERILSEKIWRPAGAATAHWRRYGPEREVSPYCCLYATARDWLRIGLFLLANGSNGRTFLPEALWRRFLGLDLPGRAIKDGHYGLHIYRNVLDRPGEALQGPFTFLLGSRGQVVYLMPEKDLVVVRFGGKIQLLHTTLYAAWRSIQ